MSATSYEVDLAFRLRESGVVGGLRAMGNSASSLVSSLTAVTGLLAAVGGGFALNGAKKAFIDFNSTVQTTKLSIATMQMQLSKGIDWTQATQRADKYYADLRETAAKSIGSTQDYLSAYQNLAVPLGLMGLKGQKAVDIAKLFVPAAAAFGTGNSLTEKTQSAAQDMRMLAQGKVGGKDTYANALLSGIGYDAAKWNAITVGSKKQQDLLVKMLTSPAILASQKAYADSFEAQFSTVESKIQEILGAMGKPLFAAVTKELASWASWLEKNDSLVQQMVSDVGSSLVTGFQTIKDVFAYIVDHKSAIIEVATAYAAFKTAHMVLSTGSAVVSAVSAAGGLSALLPAVLGMVCTPVVIGAVVAAVIAAGVLAMMRTDAERKAIDAGIDLADPSARRKSVLAAFNGSDDDVLSVMRSAGIMKDGNYNQAQAKQFSGIYADKTWGFGDMNRLQDRMDRLGHQLEQQAGYSKLLVDMQGITAAGLLVPATRKELEEKSPKPADMNVKIINQISTQDPDRFATQLNQGMERLRRAPTRVEEAFRFD